MGDAGPPLPALGEDNGTAQREVTVLVTGFGVRTPPTAPQPNTHSPNGTNLTNLCLPALQNIYPQPISPDHYPAPTHPASILLTVLKTPTNNPPAHPTPKSTPPRLLPQNLQRDPPAPLGPGSGLHPPSRHGRRPTALRPRDARPPRRLHHQGHRRRRRRRRWVAELERRGLSERAGRRMGPVGRAVEVEAGTSPRLRRRRRRRGQRSDEEERAHTGCEAEQRRWQVPLRLRILPKPELAVEGSPPAGIVAAAAAVGISRFEPSGQ
jgi:hypothetical protein